MSERQVVETEERTLERQTIEEKIEARKAAKRARKREKKERKASRKKVLKIYPVSMGKFFGVLWALFGLVVAITINVFFESFLAQVGGRASIILLPLIYGAYGFLFGIICSFIFNVVAKRTKGLIEVEVIQAKEK